jgi:hypothetical protein
MAQATQPPKATKNGAASGAGNPPPNPYDPRVQKYGSFLGLFVSREERHRLAATWDRRIGAVIILGLIVSIIYLATRPPTTYAVILDSRTHKVDWGQLIPIQQDALARELSVKAIVPNVITYAFTYNDGASYQLDIAKQVDPYVLAGDPAEAAFNKFTSDLAQAAASGNMKTHIDVDDQVVERNGKWSFGWVSRQLDSGGNVTKAEHFTADVSVAWYPGSVSNLAGLYITDFQITSDSPLPR